MSLSRILCVGESLIDVVSQPGCEPSEHVGGSLLNVANGIARLGSRASICSWWADDEHGRLIAEAAAAAGTWVEPGSQGAAATSVARATLDAAGSASYSFDLSWDIPVVQDLESVTHVHAGSIGATLEPGGTKVLDLLTRLRPTATVSYDPNVRPTIMGARDQVLSRVEEMVSLSDVVKASDADLEWLYPGVPIVDALRHWTNLGPALAVCTRGRLGAFARLANTSDHFEVPPNLVPLADTVGAGDSFMSGLISGLQEARLIGGSDARSHLCRIGWAELTPALHRAVITSSITVSRPGAYAPTLAEVTARLE